MNILQDLFWRMAGYGCCRPVHAHTLDRLFKEHHEKTQEMLNAQRAQILEYFAQLNAQQQVLEVRLVK